MKIYTYSLYANRFIGTMQTHAHTGSAVLAEDEANAHYMALKKAWELWPTSEMWNNHTATVNDITDWVKGKITEYDL